MTTILLIDSDLIAYAASRMPKQYDPDGYARRKEDVEANCESLLHNLFYEIETKYGYTPTHYNVL